MVCPSDSKQRTGCRQLIQQLELTEDTSEISLGAMHMTLQASYQQDARSSSCNLTGIMGEQHHTEN